ncbi:unnamed protein product, partial [marine sediment metagenome]
FFMEQSKKGKEWTIRRIPGLDAIDEAVGRCTELKRPLHYNVGLSNVRGRAAAQTMAGINVLTYTARLCAKYDTEMIVTCCNYEQLPYLEEAVEAEFTAVGKTVPASYVRYVGRGQGQLSIACQGIFERENIGANIMLGLYDEECVAIAEKGYRVGAMGIGGCASLGQVAILAAIMDYVLIGEEMYAAGAYISRDPVQLSTIVASDLPKIGGLILLVLGLILTQFGFNFKDLLMR